MLHELAQPEERGAVRDAGGLLHVVGHDDDRVALLQLIDQLLDALGRDGVERRRGLVHQQDVGLDGQGPRDAQPLLLADRQGEGRISEAVLHLVPQGGRPQAGLHAVLELRPRPGEAVDAQPVGDVLEHRLGKRVGLLEHHADPSAHVDRIRLRCVDLLPVDGHGTGDARRRNELVHPVQRPEKRALAASRRTDARGDPMGGDAHRHAVEGPRLAVEAAQVPDVDLRRGIDDLGLAAARRDVGQGRYRHGASGHRRNAC